MHILSISTMWNSDKYGRPNSSPDPAWRLVMSFLKPITQLPDLVLRLAATVLLHPDLSTVSENFIHHAPPPVLFHYGTSLDRSILCMNLIGASEGKILRYTPHNISGCHFQRLA